MKHAVVQLDTRTTQLLRDAVAEATRARSRVKMPDDARTMIDTESGDAALLDVPELAAAAQHEGLQLEGSAAALSGDAGHSQWGVSNGSYHFFQRALVA